MAKGDDIEERLINFAVRILKACPSLPDTPEGKHIRGQIARSGTAPPAHYSEARAAESTRDFIHKLSICLKELNETRIWLLIVLRSEMLPTTRLTDLIAECQELCKIINSSIQTSRLQLNR